MPQEFLQYGPAVIISIFAIREFFKYLKTPKNGKYASVEAILKELQQMNAELRTMNANHLHSILEAIKESGSNTTKIFEDHNSTEHIDHLAIVQVLNQIKGQLSR